MLKLGCQPNVARDQTSTYAIVSDVLKSNARTDPGTRVSNLALKHDAYCYSDSVTRLLD